VVIEHEQDCYALAGNPRRIQDRTAARTLLRDGQPQRGAPESDRGKRSRSAQAARAVDQEEVMFLAAADDRFQQGMRRLARGRARDALPFIVEAMRIQQEADGTGFSRATYLSYHGLCLCLTRNRVHEGLRDCRLAGEMDPCNPAIWWNLGRVALMLGRRGEAHRAFRKGLRVQAGHSGITRDLEKMGLRRPPVLTFLSRGNPINKLLGRIRHMRAPSPAVAEPSDAPRTRLRVRIAS